MKKQLNFSHVKPELDNTALAKLDPAVSKQRVKPGLPLLEQAVHKVTLTQLSCFCPKQETAESGRDSCHRSALQNPPEARIRWPDKVADSSQLHTQEHAESHDDLGWETSGVSSPTSCSEQSQVKKYSAEHKARPNRKYFSL